MKNSPIKTPTQDDYIKSSLRLPRELHAQLLDGAKYNGRTLNAEIIDRLQTTPVHELLLTLLQENRDMKAMIKEMHSLATGK
jgi:hypothetical protein